MWLLDAHSHVLKEFFGHKTPNYAILSHTWGSDEVTFKDLNVDGHETQSGWLKVKGCCEQAIRYGINWVWIDTCCIDKSSSAELSEAINSMFSWYQKAQICFVYLGDVQVGESHPPGGVGSMFRRSRWFTRGWTLQELLAPQAMRFYSQDWGDIFRGGDSETSMTQPYPLEEIGFLVSEVAGIPQEYLLSAEPDKTTERRTRMKDYREAPVALRLSWMAKRVTTREEDTAYCLLGLLGVNMPLLYGEGPRAFIRLQQELVRSSCDISILAWGLGMSWRLIASNRGDSILDDHIFATSPILFQHFGACGWTHNMVSTGSDLSIKVPMLPFDSKNKIWLAVLDRSTGTGILMRKKDKGDSFERAIGFAPFQIGHLSSRMPLRFLTRVRKIQVQSTNVRYGGEELLPSWIWARLDRVETESVEPQNVVIFDVEPNHTSDLYIHSFYPPNTRNRHKFGEIIYTPGNTFAYRHETSVTLYTNAELNLLVALRLRCRETIFPVAHNGRSGKVLTKMVVLAHLCVLQIPTDQPTSLDSIFRFGWNSLFSQTPDWENLDWQDSVLLPTSTGNLRLSTSTTYYYEPATFRASHPTYSIHFEVGKT